MRSFLSKVLYQVFYDFMREVSKRDNLSVLHEMDFRGQSLPDYSDSFIQKFYFLRYFPAYFIEYYFMYRQIIQRRFLAGRYHVLSMGAGCGVDFCGLDFVQKEGLIPSYDTVFYEGFDRIAWQCRQELPKGMGRYCQQDIVRMQPMETQANIIMFPMSIGEFSEQEWKLVLQMFGKSQFGSDRIVLAAALRNERLYADMPRLRELAAEFCAVQGYEIVAGSDCCETFAPYSEFAQLHPGYCYPDDIYFKIGRLKQACAQKNCRYDCCSCENDVHYWPIKKTMYAKYQIIYLERKQRRRSI